MNLIDELDGSLLKLWKFWSVRFNVLSAACSGAVFAYEGIKTVDEPLVRHIPLWIMAMLAAGAVLFTFVSIISRGMTQPKLHDPNCNDDNAEHA